MRQHKKWTVWAIVLTVVGILFLLLGGDQLIRAAAGTEGTGSAGSGVVYLVVGFLALWWSRRLRLRAQRDSRGQ